MGQSKIFRLFRSGGKVYKLSRFEVVPGDYRLIENGGDNCTGRLPRLMGSGQKLTGKGIRALTGEKVFSC